MDQVFISDLIAREIIGEALAADIAHLCLQQPRVQQIPVRIEKPGAVRFSRSVGVGIERSEEDLV
jgi:dihydroneopterin aldolase